MITSNQVTPRVAVVVAGAAVVVVQLLADVGALLTGGFVVLLLAGAAVVLTLRARPRGSVIGAALLAGGALFQLPWALFVSTQTRAVQGEPGLWSWAAMVVAVIALAASGWSLSAQPRGRLALDRTQVTSMAGITTLLPALGAVPVAMGSIVAGGGLGLSTALLVGAGLVLRTFRVAEPARHLADVVVATSLFAGLVWWVFVGTLQGATRGVGLLIVAVLVFLALVARTGRATDATPPTLGGSPVH